MTESSNGEETKATGSLVTDFANTDLTQNSRDSYALVKNANGEIIGNCAISITIQYSTFFGDSLEACRLSVYELNKKGLNGSDDTYLTTINPKDYSTVNSTSLLGTKAYTAVDQTIPDSIRFDDDYVKNVFIKLNVAKAQELGSRIFSSARANKENFYKVFQDVFRGIYVKSDYGDGVILYVNKVRMDVESVQYATDSITGVRLHTTRSDAYGRDSISYTGRSFFSTREVIQANQLQNDTTEISSRINEPNWTYLKSPAGIFTEVTLPVEAINQQLSQDTLNAAKLTFINYNQPSDKKYGLPLPDDVLLIRKKDMKTFFVKNQLTDNISSFVASHSGNQYVFSNITQMINLCLNEKAAAAKAGTPLDEDWNKAVLISVLVTREQQQSSSSIVITKVQHDLKPTYVRLKGGPGTNPSAENPDLKLKLEVISTSFNGATTKK